MECYLGSDQLSLETNVSDDVVVRTQGDRLLYRVVDGIVRCSREYHSLVRIHGKTLGLQRADEMGLSSSGRSFDGCEIEFGQGGVESSTLGFVQSYVWIRLVKRETGETEG